MIKYEELPMKGKRIFLQNEFNKILDEQIIFTDDWIEHKRCDCVDKIKEGKILNCQCVRDAIIINFGKQTDKIVKLSEELNKEELDIRRKEINYNNRMREWDV